jgi:hypothetical protein
MAMHTGKATSDALLLSHIRLSKNNSLSRARCYMLVSGKDAEKTDHARVKQFIRVSFHQGISGSKRVPRQINREKS